MRQRALPQTTNPSSSSSSPIRKRRPLPSQQQQPSVSRSLSPLPLGYENSIKKSGRNSSSNSWDSTRTSSIDTGNNKKKHVGYSSQSSDDSDGDDMIDPYRQRPQQPQQLQHPLQGLLSPHALAASSASLATSTATKTASYGLNNTAVAYSSDPEILHDEQHPLSPRPHPSHHLHYHYYPQRYYQHGEVFFRKTGNKQRTRPQDFHTVYRTPHHVPDRKFKEYLLKLGNSNKNKIPQQSRNPPMVTEECATRSCMGFSLVAVAFLVFIGILFDTQPLYIKGSLPSEVVMKSNGKSVQAYLLPKTVVNVGSGSGSSSNRKSNNNFKYLYSQHKYNRERLLPATVSYHAALAYTFTAIFCWYRLHRGWVHAAIQKRRQNNRHYEDIPDHHHSLYDPDENGDHHEQGGITRAYSGDGMLVRLKASLRQWLASRGWFFFYRSGHKLKRKREPKCV